MSKILEQLRKNKKVMFVDDEREIGNYIIVTLNYGWRFPDGEYSAEHVRSFDTVKEVRDGVNKAVLCECAECKAKEQAV